MSKLSTFFSKIGYWLTGGSGQGVKTGNVILLGLLIIVPLFLLMAGPWLAWVAIAPENRYLDKYNWLQTLTWVWPLIIFVLGFIGILVSIIYNSVKGTGK